MSGYRQAGSQRPGPLRTRYRWFSTAELVIAALATPCAAQPGLIQRQYGTNSGEARRALPDDVARLRHLTSAVSCRASAQRVRGLLWHGYTPSRMPNNPMQIIRWRSVKFGRRQSLTRRDADAPQSKDRCIIWRAMPRTRPAPARGRRLPSWRSNPGSRSSDTSSSTQSSPPAVNKNDLAQCQALALPAWQRDRHPVLVALLRTQPVFGSQPVNS